jgi:hypothetical protein
MFFLFTVINKIIYKYNKLKVMSLSVMSLPLSVISIVILSQIIISKVITRIVIVSFKNITWEHNCNRRGQYYKTFYGGNLQIFKIS